MASYDALKSVSLSDSSRLQMLQRSISVQEVVLASLKGEFERQKNELVSSEEEVRKLRKDLSKKGISYPYFIQLHDFRIVVVVV